MTDRLAGQYFLGASKMVNLMRCSGPSLPWLTRLLLALFCLRAMWWVKSPGELKIASYNLPSAGLLHPLPIPFHPMSHIALEYVTGLLPSSGNNVILTMMDHLSKVVHFTALHKLPSAKETAWVIIDHVFRIHGFPEDVVSDRGPQFISHFWKEFCQQIGPLSVCRRGSICRPSASPSG